MNELGFVWVVSVLLSMVLFLVLTLILIPILNPIFDPDWKARYHERTRRGLPFFAVMRVMGYAGSVASRTLARRIFHNPDYDFRGRVGRLVYLLRPIRDDQMTEKEAT